MAASVNGQDSTFVKDSPKPGDGILSFLNRYNLLDSCDRHFFYFLNEMEGYEGLRLEHTYRLPLWVKKYNGKSIRSTLAVDDYDYAKQIADFNDSLYARGVKPGDYRLDSILWIPNSLIHCAENNHAKIITNQPMDEDTSNTVSRVPKIPKVETKEVETVTFALLGKDDEVVDIRSDKLKGHIYYLVSGHGGPDPGAIGSYGHKRLCEDEYAYDVTLRLANNLIRHGAKIYVIIQDENDGIRNDEILPCDDDEVNYGGYKLPRNQLSRLKMRADAINKLYRENQKKGIIQRQLVFHVDSRAKSERVDMFFYHTSRSRSGRKMAESLRAHIDKQYGIHQKNRGYKGTVASRNLYMLNKTLPTTVYIELGNIRNGLDQKRFLLASNRQAIANWFTDGILNYELSFKPKVGS